MKKALPFIILGIIVIVIVWVAFRQKKQAQIAATQTMQPVPGAQTTPIVSSPPASSCTCENDSSIQNAVEAYNQTFGEARTLMYRMIKENCPCINL